MGEQLEYTLINHYPLEDMVYVFIFVLYSKNNNIIDKKKIYVDTFFINDIGVDNFIDENIDAFTKKLNLERNKRASNLFL